MSHLEIADLSCNKVERHFEVKTFVFVGDEATHYSSLSSRIKWNFSLKLITISIV